MSQASEEVHLFVSQCNFNNMQYAERFRPKCAPTICAGTVKLQMTVNFSSTFEFFYE